MIRAENQGTAGDGLFLDGPSRLNSVTVRKELVSVLLCCLELAWINSDQRTQVKMAGDGREGHRHIYRNSAAACETSIKLQPLTNELTPSRLNSYNSRQSVYLELMHSSICPHHGEAQHSHVGIHSLKMFLQGSHCISHHSGAHLKPTFFFLSSASSSLQSPTPSINWDDKKHESVTLKLWEQSGVLGRPGARSSCRGSHGGPLLLLLPTGAKVV